VRPAVKVARHLRVMSVTNTATRTDRQLSTRLQREWDQLNCRRAVLARARSWHVTPRPFRSLDELLRIAGFKSAHSAETDDVLRRLVVIAAGEPLAARIVLQRLLPGLLAIVRQEQQRDRSVDAFDLLAGEAWLAIVSYRADRRPTNVAARLLNDARHRAFTTPRRRNERSPEDFVPTATLDLPRLPQPGSSFEELTIVLREARQDGLTDSDLAAVGDYLAGRPADERDVTPRTMRNRRHRAIERIKILAA
jgi:hypothetical protein